MDILMLVDRLEAVINGGWRPPMTDKVMIDEREALDVLDLMRTAIPEEIKQSRRVNQDRERLIADAQTDAGRLMAQAQEQLDVLVNGEAVVQHAQQRAQEIEDEAHSEAEGIRSGADQYACQVLDELDARLQQLMAEVRNGLKALTPAPRYDDAMDANEFDLEPVEAGYED
jgi:cell division septum initiation protein DivIVA